MTAEDVREISGAFPADGTAGIWRNVATRSFDKLEAAVDDLLAEGYSTSDVLLQLQADTLLGGGRRRIQEAAGAAASGGDAMDVDEGAGGGGGGGGGGVSGSGSSGDLPCAKGKLSKIQMARICMKLAAADVALLDCADEELQLKDVAVHIMATCN